jgi:hypothetical protein
VRLVVNMMYQLIYAETKGTLAFQSKSGTLFPITLRIKTFKGKEWD